MEKATKEISELSRKFFNKAEENKLYLSILNFPSTKIQDKEIIINSDNVTCLRSCLMKPEHLDWIDELWNRIEKTMNEI